MPDDNLGAHGKEKCLGCFPPFTVCAWVCLGTHRLRAPADRHL